LIGGILAGVTRIVVMEICRDLGVPVTEAAIPPVELARADGIFLSLSSWGIVEIGFLDGRDIARSPLTSKIRTAYHSLTESRPL
jgi:D-alanine transaminase